MRGRPRTFTDIVPADVAGALDQLGIDYVIRGDEAVALCPSPDHDDHSPSWSCNLESGRHHCWSCGYGGSFTRLVANVRGERMGEAQIWIRTQRVQANLDGVEIVTQAKERRAAEVRESDLWLCGDPPADQLADRGISLEAARAAEILWHRDKECWIFPVREPRTGKLLGWQEKSQRRFMNRPASLNKRASLFGMEHLKTTGKSGPVVVVESPIDVAKFIDAGIHRAVSTFGVEFTEDQINVLWDWADQIVFAMDNDLAGQRKVARWLHEHPGDRLHYFVFDYGTAYDSLTFRGWTVHPAGDGRDPGNLSDEDLRWGAENATPAVATCFEDVSWA